MPGPRKAKSSLKDHHFPAFYACYLLKSVRTPRSNATYIGSTPSPPRRIRQHNGEITQGAWKTKHNRPWVMQMIVHGFPSKLAALQFEWAWQKPHISRHLRDEDGKPVFLGDRKSRYLKTNVLVARSMICSHPYNTWPLQVKLFTEDAVKAWTQASTNPNMLPPPIGFTYTTELEGVDGKSGQYGTGRNGPIDVTDSQFTADHLRKWTTMLASGEVLTCAVCKAAVEGHPPDPLTTAVCPASSCRAVAHLHCLASNFLGSQASHTQIIPRGGTCPSCHSYTLWGDIIRGCYRRRGGPTQSEKEDDEDEDAASAAEGNAAVGSPVMRRSKGNPLVDRGKRRRLRANADTSPDMSDEEEFFDLDVSGTDDDDGLAASPVRPRTLGLEAAGAIEAWQGHHQQGKLATGSVGVDFDEPQPRGIKAGRQNDNEKLAMASGLEEGSQRMSRGSETNLSLTGNVDPEANPVLFINEVDLPQAFANSRSRDEKSTFRSLPRKRLDVPSLTVGKDAQKSHSHNKLRSADGSVITIMDTREGGEAPTNTSVTLSDMSHTTGIPAACPKKRALAPFPALPPLSRPRHSPRAGQQLLASSQEQRSIFDEKGHSDQDSLLEQAGQRYHQRETKEDGLSAEEDSSHSNSSQLTHALSSMSVCSVGNGSTFRTYQALLDEGDEVVILSD